MMFAGRFNGGHFNPAVTLAVLTREGRGNLKKNFPIAWLILMFQIVGGFIGCYLAFQVQTITGNVVFPGLVQLCPASNYDGSRCAPPMKGFSTFFVEVVTTFIFISVIMIAKYDENGSDQLIPNAAMIAGTLYVMLNTAGKISGAALNPAVGLCQQVFQAQVYGTSTHYWWCYVFGPFLGGFLAALASIYSGWSTDAEVTRLEEVEAK